MGEVEVYAALAIVAALGLAMMFDAIRKFREYRFLKDTPTSTIASAALGDVEIKGTVRVPEDYSPPVSPVTGTECVLTEYEVESTHSLADDWTTEAIGVAGIPFIVTDETGEALINPDYDRLERGGTGMDVDIEGRGEDTRKVRKRCSDETLESETSLRRFASREGFWTDIESNSLADTYRVQETPLKPGEDVVVIGNGESPDMTETAIDDDYDLTIRNADGQSGLFLIANQSEDTLLAERRRFPFYMFPIGALTFASGVVALLMYAGLL